MRGTALPWEGFLLTGDDLALCAAAPGLQAAVGCPTLQQHPSWTGSALLGMLSGSLG